MSIFEAKTTVWSLVKVPAIITLCVTLVRLLGELMDLSETLFGSSAGGGSSVVGISWLIAVFGFWFGRRLRITGGGPDAGKVAITTIIAMGIVAGGIFGLAKAGVIVLPDPELKSPPPPAGLGYFYAMCGLGAAIVLTAWPRLGLALLLYGLLARIPIVIITYFAVIRNWDTHHVKTAPGVPELEGMDLVLTLCIPQLTFWVALTIIAGTLCGALGASTARRQH